MPQYLIFFCFLILSTSSFAFRIGSQNEKWQTTSTPHFVVIHSAKHQDLGLYYAEQAELAYAQLSQIFKNKPELITLIINDSTDLSNGYATVVPYPHIMIYPVQIGLEQTLSESAEWSRELITHELTHIFQLYPYNGVYKYLRPIFGSITSPNLITPTWWKEGMAVEMETLFSPRGRSRSALQSATLRALSIEDNALLKTDLSEANEALVTWPFGNRPYFWGSLLFSEMTSEKNPSSIGELVELQSYRAPYFVEKPASETLGMSYSQYFKQTLFHIDEKIQKDLLHLKTKPITESVSLNPEAIASRWPQIHPSQPIAANILTTPRGSRIQFYDISESNNLLPSTVYKSFVVDAQSFSFHPLEKSIVYSKTELVSSKELFSDLYIYQLDQQKKEQLTFGARARLPVFSPSGQNLCYISTADGKTKLELLNLETKKSQVLFLTNFKERLTESLFLNENEILFILRTSEGANQLKKITLNTSNITEVETGFTDIQFLRSNADYLYFTSAQSGVSNIYKSKMTEGKLIHTQPVTHLLTGAFSFDVKNDLILSTQITAKGLFVFQNRNEPKEIVEIRKNYQNKNSEFKPSQVPEFKPVSDEYSIFPYIYPHYWIPFISSNNQSNGALIQAITSGHDPLNTHQYQINLGYDTYQNNFSFLGSYINSVYDHSFALTSQRSFQTFSGTDYQIQKDQNQFTLIPDVFGISKDLQASLGYVHINNDDDFRTLRHHGGFIQLAINEIEPKAYQYHPQSGWGVNLRYQNLKAQNEQGLLYSDYSQVLGSASYYESRFLPRDHAMNIKLDALYTFEDVSKTRFGTSNSAYPAFSDGLIPQFLLRGYQEAQFFGSQMITTNLEYRFPIKNLHRGTGTDPYYLKHLTGAIFVDGLATNGYGLTTDELLNPLKLSQQIYSAGAEIRLATTIGYFLPVQIIFGGYYPFSSTYSKNTQFATSLLIGGF